MARPPVRGTQTFVGVMSAVWGRPSLSALELGWRWLIGIPLLAIAAWLGLRTAGSVKLETAALQAMTVFQPVAAFQTIDRTLAVLEPALRPFIWLFPVVAVAWIVVAAMGRMLVLRRLETDLAARPLAMVLLGALRTALLTVFWVLWIACIRWAGDVAIIRPAAQGIEPNLVLYCAIVICGTLLLYVLWAIISWPLQLAPLLAMRNNSGALAGLRTAFASKRELRSKLIETNLVMCIVRIVLIVLAMVLSASPLAFQTVATQEFFIIWWAIAVLLYFAASDYFHVVRAAAYLALWKSV